jgi:hypothetical protein
MLLNLFTKKNKEVQARHTLIHHHLGLGDYILLSGGIKYLVRKGKIKSAFILCLEKNAYSVSQLYEDTEKIDIISVTNWDALCDFLVSWKGEIKTIGYDLLEDYEHFDVEFYNLLGVNFEERWNSFSIQRNWESEKKLLEELKLPDKFAFVHDDASRGFIIEDKYLMSGLPVIRPFITKSIFDWIGVLENATEIHCMCSSFKHLVDSLPNITDKLYYHWSNVNSGKPRENSVSQSRYDWKIL